VRAKEWAFTTESFVFNQFHFSFFNIMICLSQLFPIFLWKDFLNSSHVFYGNGMNFLYPLGFFSRLFPNFFPSFWVMNSFSFAKLQKICQSHFI